VKRNKIESYPDRLLSIKKRKFVIESYLDSSPAKKNTAYVDGFAPFKSGAYIPDKSSLYIVTSQPRGLVLQKPETEGQKKMGRVCIPYLG
jgi:hypothetical protein